MIIFGKNSGSCKKYIKDFFINSGSLRFLSSFREPSVVILRYHSVLENPEEINAVIGSGLVHSAEAFEMQMKMLSDYFSPVTMDDLLGFINGKRLPRRAVVISFDDGFADNVEVAAPIMEKYGIRGAFYVTTSSIAPQPLPWFFSLRRAFYLTKRCEWVNRSGEIFFKLDVPEKKREAFLQACKYAAVLNRTDQLNYIHEIEIQLDISQFIKKHEYMMTELQINNLHKKGHIIGSHTVSHQNIAHVNENEVRYEMENSKFFLEKIIGCEIVHFSYPSPILQPHYNEMTIKISKELGYKTGLTCTHGLVHLGDDPLVCRRVAVPNSSDELRWNIEFLMSGFREQRRA